MIRDEQLPELPQLRRVERSLPFRVDSSFSDLVVASGNVDFAVHRWFRLKESFSPELLPRIVRHIYAKLPRSLSILDPFAGVGTTLLASQALAAQGVHVNAIGIERNPFIAFAARTKINWSRITAQDLLREGTRALQIAETVRPVLPHLSSIRTGRCISVHASRKIVAIRDAIRQLNGGPTADGLLLGLAAVIESLSKTRKDGRALRIVNRRAPAIEGALFKSWQRMADDCEGHEDDRVSIPLLLEGDGRDPRRIGVAAESVDLVFTSPPYPNNIDYNEVYKLEMWLLGFVNCADEFLTLRRQTFRSHPTCATPEVPPSFMHEIDKGKLRSVLQPLFSRAAKDPRLRMFTGYFADMWVTLRNLLVCLRKGGYAIFVVGNSLHGNSNTAYLLPTDLVTARIAEIVGFTVCDTIAARNLRRRLSGNHFLRESIVVLRKPNGRSRQIAV